MSRRETLDIVLHACSCEPEARITARMIRVWVPQRQMAPSSPCFTSSTVGFGVLSSRALARMIIPLVQYPHWRLVPL